MKRDIEQRNQAYKKGLGQAILTLFPESELIVSDVLLDPSMQHGRVWMKGPTPLIEELNKRRRDITAELQRHIKTRYMPSLQFILDDRYLEHLDEIFESIDKN